MLPAKLFDDQNNNCLERPKEYRINQDVFQRTS